MRSQNGQKLFQRKAPLTIQQKRICYENHCQNDSLDYIRSSLLMTFDHFVQTVNEDDLLGFLRGVLQIYFTCQECEYMMTGIVFLEILYLQFKYKQHRIMDHLDKINLDLSIFHINLKINMLKEIRFFAKIFLVDSDRLSSTKSLLDLSLR